MITGDNGNMSRQKTPSSERTGFLEKLYRYLVGRALGSFERIDFLCFFSVCRFNVGGQVAVTIFPFRVRLRACGAVPLGCVFGLAVTTVTLFNDFMAGTAIVGAAGGSHKMALMAFSDSCAKQWNYLLN